MSRGELLQAYDLTDQALIDFPNDPQLKYMAVLTLARAGATRQARARYDKFQFAQFLHRGDPGFQIDVESLNARIAKNAALEASGVERERLLAEAAQQYEDVFRRTRDSYPGINAATLSLLRGQTGQAESLASEVLARCEGQVTEGRGDSYYLWATIAEAALVLGRSDDARSALEAAGRLHGGDFAAVATTRRQLRLVCEARSLSTAILSILAAPSVVHFCGHMIGPRFPESGEASVRNRIAEVLERRGVGFGYGSLAAGSDILFAEELLRRGAEVNIAMPFDVEEFKRVSVAPAGKKWLARFEECLRAAKGITYATTDEYLGDDSLFGYASRIAMGLALLRVRFLDTTVSQIAVWDGAGVGGSERTAGVGADASVWRTLGFSQEIISPFETRESTHVQKTRPQNRPRSPSSEASGRSIKAMLFGDIKGFSTLREAQLPIFVREMLGRFALVLDRHREGILFRNTWGDGLYVVARDVVTAAICAVELQEEMASFVPAESGLPESMGLRLGGHLGPVFRVRDPVLRRQSFIGAHVSRAARIEPITPEGAVYVTEAFAAVLASSVSTDFVCEYVGQVPAAKHYGTMRMYSLRRIAGDHAPIGAS
jgi:class 3 adenylate cyclase